MKVNFQYAENVKSPTQSVELFFLSDPDRIQTCNRWSRNPVRYSVAPRGLKTVMFNFLKKYNRIQKHATSFLCS